MKRTKRWLLIFAALVCLMAHAGAIKATSLIFGKFSTSTTTTTTQNPSNEEEETTELPVVATNETSTKPVLTGIPQIDYIWDPNLPRELNGYNLSEYPFYNSVPPPEEIDFKCDGLHDGFYASVKHKCQLYHHCLFGIRYDFLCANFTAFDQKTFICHFVSEVDCKNSPKYYHRNDALYQAATSSTTTTTTTPAPPSTAAPVPASDVDRSRQGRPHRRPLRRRRPQVDYYYDDEDYDDDYFDDRITRRRKQRPRIRRPDYEDDYDDRRVYRDEDRYDKRPYNRDRMPEDSDEYEYDRRKSERPRNRNRPGDNRRTIDDERNDRRNPSDRRRPVDDRRPSMTDRRFNNEDRRSFFDERRHQMDRSKSQESDELDDDRRSSSGRRRLNGDRRPNFDDNLDRPHRRDQIDDAYSDKKEHKLETKSEEKPLVRPSGTGSTSSLSSLFERPRAPPKISRPVPLTEKKKYEYTSKKVTTTVPPPLSEEEYYDEYEEPVAKVTSKEEKPARGPDPQNYKDYRKPFSAAIREDPRTRYETVRNPEPTEESRERPTQNSRYRQMIGNRSRYNTKSEESVDIEDSKSKSASNDRFSSRNPPINRFEVEKPDIRYEKERENLHPKEFTKPRPLSLEEPDYKSYSSEEAAGSQSEEDPIKEVKPIVRIVKRPFLPSRGGSPYLPRGLQPVGAAQKSLETTTTPRTTTTIQPTTTTTTTTTTESMAIDMGSTISGVRLLEHGAPILRGSLTDTDYPAYHKGPRTTQKPQIEPPRSPLDDIFENDYDVTLNDALNPTLKPLTSNRGPPTGFSYLAKYDRDRYTFHPAPANNNDSLYSSSAVRSSAIQSPSSRGSQTPQFSRGSHVYYDDYEY